MKKTHLLYIFVIIVVMCVILLNSNTGYAKQSSLDIKSPSVVLLDAESGQILYGINENVKSYPASITKLMTALLAIENLQANDTLTFSKNAVYSIEYGSSHIGIQAGEVLTVDQAMNGLLLMSANEIANGLAEKISGSIDTFADLMNTRAKELGATHSNFVNPHGLHDDNHYTTAYDIALIAKELIKKDYFLSIMKDITYQIPPTNKSSEIRYLSQQHEMMNNLRYPDSYREDVIGGKTGYTDEANHTVVTIAKEGNQTLIAVVMESASKDDMYCDTNKLLDYGFTQYKNVDINPIDYEETLPIIYENNTIGEATIAINSPMLLSVDKSYSLSLVDKKIELPSTLSGDTMVGDKVGKIIFYENENALSQADMYVQKITLNKFPAVNPPSNVPLKSYYPAAVITALLFVCSIIYYRTHSTGSYSRYVRKRKR